MNSPRPTLITGAEGQLGRALTNVFASRGEVIACNRAMLDLTSPDEIAMRVREAHPGVILNCAAYNDVDGAEDHAIEAFEINAMAVRSLARAARLSDARLVHYGTDFVFDGTATRPYTETDRPSPRSIYAASKLTGEWFAADAGAWFVLRVESLFGVRHSPGTRRVGSIDRIIDSLEQRQPVKAFRDRVVSPSYLVDVAAATCALIDRNAESGVYHAVNTGHCTWYELAHEIARQIGGAEVVEPIDAATLQLRAARPQFAALDNTRLASAAYAMPTWQDAIARYLSFRQRPATI